jgi:hypothetical protein
MRNEGGVPLPMKYVAVGTDPDSRLVGSRTAPDQSEVAIHPFGENECRKSHQNLFHGYRGILRRVLNCYKQLAIVLVRHRDMFFEPVHEALCSAIPE